MTHEELVTFVRGQLTARDMKVKDLAAIVGMEANKLTKSLSGARKFEAPEALLIVQYFEAIDKLQPKPVIVEHNEVGPSDRDLVPVYDVAASAGFGGIIDSEYEMYSLAFPPNFLSRLTTADPTKLAIISVNGESMEPTLLANDIVLLDLTKTNLSYDGLFVLRFGDALHVKRIGRSVKPNHVMILSDNSALFPPLEAPVADIQPIGKVLWYGRKVL